MNEYANIATEELVAECRRLRHYIAAEGSTMSEMYIHELDQGDEANSVIDDDLLTRYRALDEKIVAVMQISEELKSRGVNA